MTGILPATDADLHQPAANSGGPQSPPHNETRDAVQAQASQAAVSAPEGLPNEETNGMHL